MKSPNSPRSSLPLRFFAALCLLLFYTLVSAVAMAKGNQEELDAMEKLSTEYLAKNYPDLKVTKLEVKHYWKSGETWSVVTVDFNPVFSFQIFRTATETRDDLKARLLTQIVRKKYESFFARRGVGIDSFILRFVQPVDAPDYRKLTYNGQEIDNFEIDVVLEKDTAEDLKQLTREFILYSREIGIPVVHYKRSAPLILRSGKFYCAIPFYASQSKLVFALDDSTALEVGSRGR